MDLVFSLFGWIQNSLSSRLPWGLMSLNELVATSQGTHSPRGGMHRKSAGFGGMKIPAQRHCAQRIYPEPLGLLGYHCLFSGTIFLLLRKDQNTFFFFFQCSNACFS